MDCTCYSSTSDSLSKTMQEQVVFCTSFMTDQDHYSENLISNSSTSKETLTTIVEVVVGVVNVAASFIDATTSVMSIAVTVAIKATTTVFTGRSLVEHCCW